MADRRENGGVVVWNVVALLHERDSRACVEWFEPDAYSLDSHVALDDLVDRSIDAFVHNNALQLLDPLNARDLDHVVAAFFLCGVPEGGGAGSVGGKVLLVVRADDEVAVVRAGL